MSVEAKKVDSLTVGLHAEFEAVNPFVVFLSLRVNLCLPTRVELYVAHEAIMGKAGQWGTGPVIEQRIDGINLNLGHAKICKLVVPIVEEGVEEALALTRRDERVRLTARSRCRSRTHLCCRSRLRDGDAEAAQGKRIARRRLLLVHELLHFCCETQSAHKV